MKKKAYDNNIFYDERAFAKSVFSSSHSSLKLFYTRALCRREVCDTVDCKSCVLNSPLLGNLARTISTELAHCAYSGRRR